MEDWIITLIACILNIIVSLFIIFIYVKSKFKMTYAFYFNIFFTLVIFLRNFIRALGQSENEGLCYTQAFILSTFDKLIQTQITSYSIINYIGMFKNQFFRDNEKYIFIILSSISFVYGIVLSIIYINQGLSSETYSCYVKTSDIVKRVLDTILSVLLLLINLFCSLRIIITLCQNLKNAADVQKSSIKYHLVRFIFEIILVTSMFLLIICIVNKLFTSPDQKDIRDIIYEAICFIMELFYTMNSEFIKEAKRILTCQPVNKGIIVEDNENSGETVEEKLMEEK